MTEIRINVMSAGQRACSVCQGWPDRRTRTERMPERPPIGSAASGRSRRQEPTGRSPRGSRSPVSCAAPYSRFRLRANTNEGAPAARRCPAPGPPTQRVAVRARKPRATGTARTSIGGAASWRSRTPGRGGSTPLGSRTSVWCAAICFLFPPRNGSTSSGAPAALRPAGQCVAPVAPKFM